MLRPAVKKDVPRLVDITRQSIPLLRAAGNPQWSYEYPGERDFLRDIRAKGLFVYDDGVVKGFVAVGADDFIGLPFTPCQKPMALHRLAVAPDARGQGIGRSLFICAYQEAVKRGCDMIRTDTHETNLPMNALMMSQCYRFVTYFTRDGWEGRFCAYEKPVKSDGDMSVLV